jgi:intein/homing endonuclease
MYTRDLCINAGAWGTKIEGFTSIDIMPETNPDIVADIREFEVGDNTVKECYCFDGDTFISGINKQIKDIVIGDIVTGKSGTGQTVIGKYERKYCGEFVKIEPIGTEPVIVTSNHKILCCRVKRKHVRSWHNKTIGERKNVYVWDVSKYEWKEAGKLEDGDYVVCPRMCRFNSFDIEIEVGRKHEKKTIIADYDVGRILGLYVAEGSISEKCNHVVFSLGSHEKELAYYIVNTLDRKFGIRSHISYPNNMPTEIKVIASNSSLLYFLKREFGCYSHEKYISNLIMNGCRDVICGFISGLSAGDGYKTKSRQMQVVTVSRILANQLFLLLHKIGVSCSIRSRKPLWVSINGYNSFGRKSYSIRFPSYVSDGEKDYMKKCSSFRGKFNNEFTFIPIRKTTHFTDTRIVYNLHTTDESYCVPFIVHNCSHIIEHFWYKDAMALLRKFNRWLKSDGILWIAVPDFELISQFYCAGDYSQYLMGLLYGNNRYETDVHRHPWTRKSLEKALNETGFVVIDDNFKPWVHNADGTAWDASSMWYEKPDGERVGISINFKCRKELEVRNT